MPAWRKLQCGIVLGLLLQGEAGLAASPAPAATEARSFLALSDIHFDPFFDPSLVADLVKADPGQWQAIFERSTVQGVGAYGKDSPYPLLKSTLTAAARFAPHADLVVITGDFLGHNFLETFAQYSPSPGSAGSRRFALKATAFVTAMIRQAFPPAAWIAALGNNDSDCGDYELEPAGRFLAGLTTLWQPHPPAAAGSFSRTFPIDGHFSVPHPIVPHLRVVVLNTVLFSPKFKSCGTGGDAGARELAWLERTLRDASSRGDKVWLVYHIPPGIDFFATLHASGACAQNPVTTWRTDSMTSFWGILAKFPGLVNASFAGHTHMDEFRLPAVGGFIHVTPAVSPIFGNNPGFAVFSYAAATGEIANFQTYYLDIATSGSKAPQWALEYDFQQAFAQPAVNASTLQTVQRAIASDPAVRERYLTFYPVSSSLSATDLVHWRAQWCVAQVFSPQEFAACYCPTATSP